MKKVIAEKEQCPFLPEQAHEDVNFKLLQQWPTQKTILLHSWMNSTTSVKCLMHSTITTTKVTLLLYELLGQKHDLVAQLYNPCFMVVPRSSSLWIGTRGTQLCDASKFWKSKINQTKKPTVLVSQQSLRIITELWKLCFTWPNQYKTVVRLPIYVGILALHCDGAYS